MKMYMRHKAYNYVYMHVHGIKETVLSTVVCHYIYINIIYIIAMHNACRFLVYAYSMEAPAASIKVKKLI